MGSRALRSRKLVQSLVRPHKHALPAPWNGSGSLSLTTLPHVHYASLPHLSVFVQEVLADGSTKPAYSAHYQRSLACYANPSNINWMPGGVIAVAGGASTAFHAQGWRSDAST